MSFLSGKGDHLKSKTFEEVFKNLKNHGAKGCVIASSGGLPIAWFGLEKKSVELFSTLSAAIMSASRILHRDVGKSSPQNIISEGKDSFMVLQEINDDAIIVIFGEKKKDEMFNAIKKAAKELRGVVT